MTNIKDCIGTFIDMLQCGVYDITFDSFNVSTSVIENVLSFVSSDLYFLGVTKCGNYCRPGIL